MTGYREFITEWGNKRLLSKWGNLQSFVDRLYEETNYLPSDATLRQRFWHETNNTTVVPRCKQCGQNTTKFDKGAYKEYCSTKCSNNSPDVQQKKKTVCMSKYGVNNPSQADSVKKVREATNIERHGAAHYWQTDVFKNNMRAMSLAKFGTEHHTQAQSVQDTKKATVQERYGVDNVFQHPDIKQKIQQTLGVAHVKHVDMDPQTVAKLCDIDFLLDENKTKSLVQIAAEIGCNPSTIEHRIKEAGFDTNKSHTTSLVESEIKKYIAELGVTFVENDRTVIVPKEIDIYIPEHSIGIEVNGCYWHSADKKDKHYHIDKTLSAAEGGVQLIHIFDIDWTHKKDIVKHRLANLLRRQERVFARKCEVRLVPRKEEHAFISSHHLQGSTLMSSISLGLYHGGSLVAAMTFGKPRYTASAQYELLRYCSSVTVVGGASKLFSHFAKVYSPESVISYADRTWSGGNLYRTLGFDDCTANPHNVGYFYTDGNRKYHRSNFTKAKLVKQGFDATLTESAIMSGRGFTRVWDCGNYTFVWTKSD